MAWQTDAPDGTKSVKSNNTILQDNTNYTKTTQNVDHYWDTSTNQDGHHNVVEMDQQGTSASPTEASLSTGMDGVIYCKSKSSSEAPDNQDVQLFFKNNKDVDTPGVTQIMQLLGIRAMGVFDSTTSNGAVTLQYSQNCTVNRDALGVYTVTFGTNVASDNYLVLGNCIRNNATAKNVGLFTMSGSTSLALKTVSSFEFRTFSFSGSPSAIDPTQTWFVVFGG
jgi:hypothetical protein